MSVQVNDQRRYPPGVPCWVDAAQPDPFAAAIFYGALFGWELTEVMPPDAPGSYLVATLGGHDAAAIGPKDPDEPPSWRTYLACDDADTTASRSPRRRQRRLGTRGRRARGSHRDLCRSPGRRLRAVAGPTPAGRAGRQRAELVELQRPPHPRSRRGTGVLRRRLRLAVDPELGAGMIRLPGYGDHLAATVDPDIHIRQEAAPPGFADVVAGLSCRRLHARVAGQVHRRRPRRECRDRRAAGRHRPVLRRHDVDPRGRDPRPAGGRAHAQPVHPARLIVVR